jgi:hypothetical protein
MGDEDTLDEPMDPLLAPEWEVMQDTQMQEMQLLVDQLVEADQAQLIAPALNSFEWATQLSTFVEREGADSFAMFVDLVSRLHVNDDLSVRVREVQGTNIYARRWRLHCDAVGAMRGRGQQKRAG